MTLQTKRGPKMEKGFGDLVDSPTGVLEEVVGMRDGWLGAVGKLTVEERGPAFPAAAALVLDRLIRVAEALGFKAEGAVHRKV